MNKRELALLYALCTCAGCHTQSGTQRPALDPFLGPTKIPAPATGTTVAPQASADPYYNGNSVTRPGSYAPSNPLGTGSGIATPYTPPGGYTTPASPNPPPASYYQQGSTGNVRTTRREPLDEEVATARFVRSETAEADASDERPPILLLSAEEEIMPAASPLVVPTGKNELRIVGSSTPTASNREQPMANQQVSTALPPAPPRPTGLAIKELRKSKVVPASATVAVPERPAQPKPSTDMATAIRVGSATGYGHAPNYSWLTGRLEFSQIERQWKLRYIPIDGATDAYGGSVVLSDAAQLKGFEANDFVTVVGGVDSGSRAAGSFAPLYNIEQIRPLAK